MKNLQEFIEWVKDEQEKAEVEAKGYKDEGDLKTSNLFLSRSWAFSEVDMQLTLLLLNKPTVAITETAHCANTLLSECADSEDGQVIGVVGAGSSETEIVKQNEQTKELCVWCHKEPKKSDFISICQGCFDKCDI